MNILNRDGATNSMKPIDFSHLKVGKKGKLLKGNFTINRPQTLFGPDWSQLKNGRCPHCCCNLYMTRKDTNMLRCKSKKHRKAFFIHTSKIKEILANLT